MDEVLYMIDSSRDPGAEEEAIGALVSGAGCPVVVARSKIDLSARASGNVQRAPAGEPHYPPEYYTDQSPEFRISELLPEQAACEPA